MASTTPIKISIISDNTDARRGIREVDADLSGFGDKIKGNAAKIGAGLAAAFAVDQVAAFGKDIIGLASDANESMNKVSSVFGPSTAAISAFADTAADKLGLSRVAALDAAGGFGNMFDQLKIAPSVSADMSTGLLTLAADLGSFNNASTPEVVDAMTSAFRGEYDALQRFIPTINAAAVEQKALEQTHKTSASQLTDTEKALATYTLMQEGAGKAAGDFAKTADQPANAFKRAQAQWEDAKTSLGTQLMPVVAVVAKFLAENLPVAIDAVGKAFAWFKENVLPPLQEAWSNLQAFLASEEGQSGLNTIRSAIDGVAKFIMEIFPVVRDIVVGVFQFLQEFWKVWGDDIMKIVGGIFQVIKTTIESALNVIAGIINVVTGLIQGDWGRVWDGIKQIVIGVWDYIKGVVSGALSIITGILGGAYSSIKNSASGMWDGIKEAFAAALNWIVDKWNNFKIPAISVAGQQVSPEVNFPNLPRFARGGIAPGGELVMVGEEGPELITLGRTSRVYSNRDTAALINGSASTVTLRQENNFHISGEDAADIEARFRRIIAENNNNIVKLFEQGLSASSQG